jgi:hypothetical protein
MTNARHYRTPKDARVTVFARAVTRRRRTKDSHGHETKILRIKTCPVKIKKNLIDISISCDFLRKLQQFFSKQMQGSNKTKLQSTKSRS